MQDTTTTASADSPAARPLHDICEVARRANCGPGWPRRSGFPPMVTLARITAPGPREPGNTRAA
jgi:hypothetical protein